MAEASVDRPRFFCHKCAAEIRPVLPDYLCPNCNGGFIEQIDTDSTEESPSQSDGGSHQGDDQRLAIDSENDPLHTLVFSTLFSDLLNETGNRQSRRGSPTSPSSPSSSTPHSPPVRGPLVPSHTPSSRSAGAADSNRAFTMQSPGGSRTTFTVHRRGDGGAQPPPADMIAFLQQFLGLTTPSNTGPGGVYFPVQMFNIHGSPRDYAWGEGGLDAVITQLLNNAEGHGPPPASASDISTLKTIKITNVHIEQSEDCPVCKEDFQNEEEAKQLPCSHFFHPGCVVTWLELHNTCPVCRKGINETTSGSSTR